LPLKPGRSGHERHVVPRSLAYPDLVEHLVEALPELRIPLEHELKWWKGERPGPHVVFENLLAPFLTTEFSVHNRPEVVGRALQFLEEMASDPDPEVQAVVQQSVLSGMCANPNIGNLLQRNAPQAHALMREYCKAAHDHR
jgi:Lhr-like helicase